MNTATTTDSQNLHVGTESTSVPPGGVHTHASDGAPAAAVDDSSNAEPRPLPADSAHQIDQVQPPHTARGNHKKWLLLAGTVVALAAGGYYLIPWVQTAMNTVTTEDAYVNGDSTYVAPRVSGQVKRVLVKGNQRVAKGDLLVQLDKEPFEVQVALKRAAVRAAEANLTAAEAQARGLAAQLGAQRWNLQKASEQVDAQVANLRVQAAALRSQQAVLNRARADFERGKELLPTSTISREEFDLRAQNLRVAETAVSQAQEAIAQTRVSLGLPAQPDEGKSATDVPPDLNQTFSGIRAALAECMQTMSQLGLPLPSTDLTPNKVLEEFQRRNEQGSIDQILTDVVAKAPMVLQAQVALEQAQHDLDLAELNLRYCDIVSDAVCVEGRPNGYAVFKPADAASGNPLF